MKQFKAHYQDDRHDLDILIAGQGGGDDLNILSFSNGGIAFSGTCFDAFELDDPAQYEEAPTQFNLLKWDGAAPGSPARYVCDLQRYTMDMELPVCVCDCADTPIPGVCLRLSFQLVPHSPARPQSIIAQDSRRVYRDDTLSAPGLSWTSAAV